MRVSNIGSSIRTPKRPVQPPGVLVHNGRPGTRGALIAVPSEGSLSYLAEPCSCGWAPRAGVHYRAVTSDTDAEEAYLAHGWMEGVDLNSIQEGVFAADVGSGSLLFLQTARFELFEDSDGRNDLRRVEEVALRSQRIPWSAVNWVRLEPRSSISSGVAEMHSDLLARSTDPNTVVGYLGDPEPGSQLFRLIGVDDRSAAQWMELFQAAGVEVKPSALDIAAPVVVWLKGFQHWAQAEYHRRLDGCDERERWYGVYLATLLPLKTDHVTAEGIMERLRTPEATAGYSEGEQLIQKVTRFGDVPAGTYQELLEQAPSVPLRRRA